MPLRNPFKRKFNFDIKCTAMWFVGGSDRNNPTMPPFALWYNDGMNGHRVAVFDNEVYARLFVEAYEFPLSERMERALYPGGRG